MASTDQEWVPFDTLEAFLIDVLKGLRVPDEDARTCAEVLITADKRGIYSHGIGRFKFFYFDRIRSGGIQNPVTQMEILQDRKATAVVDGHGGMGMVIGKRCMEMAIDKAREHGMGMVVARNSSHYGFAAYYPLMAVEAGMIGLTGTNTRPSIAPTHGVDNMLGTNPLVFAMPTDEEFPFTNDYATSVIPQGKVEKYAREGKSCPEGVVIDREGHSPTDSQAIHEGLMRGTIALAPLGGVSEETGGHKGYGFATVVEILSAALSQGAFLKQLTAKDAQGKDIPSALGHFFMAVDIECFTDLAAFKKTTGDILRTLRASTKAPGKERIYTCGEKEYLIWQELKDKGVPLSPVVQRDLVTMRDDLKLPYVFPFEAPAAPAGS